MAHQWSGDLVTMAWWDNIWLNEGFATWMEYKATDHFNPSWEIWPRQHEAREAAMAQDAQPTTHPIQQVIRDESEAGSAFDQISYQKGEQIIRMIEDWISPDVFRTGMRAYMKAHQYSNATSADLWAALSAASGKDVAAVAAGFTEQPGIPLVHVTRRCLKGKRGADADRGPLRDPRCQRPRSCNGRFRFRSAAPAGDASACATDRHACGNPPDRRPATRCKKPIWARMAITGWQYDDASLKPLIAHFCRIRAGRPGQSAGRPIRDVPGRAGAFGHLSQHAAGA